jgi:hypothetical protein
MAQFILLVYADEAAWGRMDEHRRGELLCEYRSFAEGIKASGHMLAGAPFQPTAMATTVRMNDGKIVKTMGPVESTMHPSGYFLVEARDADEAASIAARVPSLRFGTSMEVRPLRVV